MNKKLRNWIIGVGLSILAIMVVFSVFYKANWHPSPGISDPKDTTPIVKKEVVKSVIKVRNICCDKVLFSFDNKSKELIKKGKLVVHLQKGYTYDILTDDSVTTWTPPSFPEGRVVIGLYNPTTGKYVASVEIK